MSRNSEQFFYDEESRDGAGHLFRAHDEGLYDQDENTAGERTDLVTGDRYNNSSHGYDRLSELTDDEAGEIGFSIVGDDVDFEDDERTIEYVDHWLETQEGLARAAERGISLADEDIA